MNNVLIVVDMQNDFINGSLGTPEAVAIVPNVVEKIKNFNGDIIFTRDSHEEDYLETQEGKNLPVEHCIKNTNGWNIHNEISNLVKGIIIDKVTFGSDKLVKLLVEKNEQEKIDSITLVGLCTDICVISNALSIKTFLPETSIIVDASCCAGVSKKSHLRALEAMRACQIEIE